jgi:hypothetical protein
MVEAVVAVSQPQASGVASFPLTCIGSLRLFSVAVQPTGGAFELGEAQVTASVAIQRGADRAHAGLAAGRSAAAVFVELPNTARLESGGGAVLIDVTVACPLGAIGQQSYVNVAQGQTSVGNGKYVPVCDGQQHVHRASGGVARCLPGGQRSDPHVHQRRGWRCRLLRG